MKNRVKYGMKSSGGIVVAYKQELHDFIHFHETESKYVLWFEITNKFTKFDRNVLVGSIYIPPENSKYSSREAFNEIEIEMHELMHANTCNEKHVILTGDFNARTGTESEIFYYEVEHENNIIDFLEFIHPNIPFLNGGRNNKDKTVNPYGKILIDACKSNNLLFINGRIGDNITGETTCKSVSTVDYFICDYDIFDNITNMKVLEHNILFSDVHCPIEIQLKLNVLQDKNDLSTNPEETKKIIHA